MRYGPSWRQNRRAFHHYFQPSMVENYQPLQTKCVRDLALHCLDDPKDFVRHIQRYVDFDMLIFWKRQNV